MYSRDSTKEATGGKIREFTFDSTAKHYIASLLLHDSLERTIGVHQLLDEKAKNVVISFGIIYFMYHKEPYTVIRHYEFENMFNLRFRNTVEAETVLGAAILLLPEVSLIQCLKEGWGGNKLSDFFRMPRKFLKE